MKREGRGAYQKTRRFVKHRRVIHSTQSGRNLSGTTRARPSTATAARPRSSYD